MESLGNILVYCVIALTIIVCSVLTVTTRKILRSATYLLFVLFATAMLYFQLDYPLLGAVQIAVYAGGIVVLFVFAILLTHKPGADTDALKAHRRAIGVTAALLTVALLAGAMVCFAPLCGAKLPTSLADVSVERIGHFLLSTSKYGYLLPFEAISVLLLACIIGGVVIARRR